VKHASVTAHIRQLCCLGLGAEVIMPYVLKALHDLILSDSNAFFWVDENDEITNICAEKLLPPDVMRLYFREFYDYKVGGFHSIITQTALRERHIDRANRDAGFYQSDYYNLVWREHLNAHHAMYAVIEDQGNRVGQLSLYRSTQEKAFSEQDENLLAQVTRYIAHGTAACPNSNAGATEFFDTPRTGLIILNARGEIQHLSGEGKRLLFLASHSTVSRQSLLADEEDPLPSALKQITKYLQSIFSGKSAPPPVWRIDNGWGRFVFRAFWLDAERGSDAGLIGVTVQQQEPLPLKVLGKLKTMPLPDRQKQVILLLAGGASRARIAEELNVKLNTVAYHVQQVHDRMEVHSRSELLNKFLSPLET
jgi:DNA-binding CsgD family transcriptional regulator